MLVDRQARPGAAALRHIGDAEAMDFMRLEARNLTAVEADRAAAGTPQADNGVAERAVAHAVAADDGEDTGIERQRHTLQRMAFTVVDLQVVDPEDRLDAFFAAVSHACPRDRFPALQNRYQSRAGCLPRTAGRRATTRQKQRRGAPR